MRTLCALLCAGLAGLASGCGEKEEPEAVSVGSTPTATQTSGADTVEFRSVDEAIAAIDRHLDIPVMLPDGLPEGTRLAPRGAVSLSRGRASMYLRLPGDRHLYLQFGRAGFDGCGPSRPQRVTVAGQPAVLQVRERGRRNSFTTVVWPTRKPGVDGRYGLAGQLPKSRILAWAESMERARARALTKSAGC